MENWQDKFAPHILDRGFEYYRNGQVEELEETDYGFRALVCGTETYNVEIFSEKEKLKGMVCSCPYAQKGENCKHMAAVLAAVTYSECEEAFSEGEKEQIQRKVISFDRENFRRQEEFLREEIYDVDIVPMVERADRDELEIFLLSELENDPMMQRRFKLFMTNIVESSEVNMYKEQINDIFDSFSDRHGFISYYMAGELEEALDDFIQRIVRDIMMRYGKGDEAFLLTSLIMEKLGRGDIDDSDGIVINISWQCKEIIESILDSDNEILKRRIFDWAQNLVENKENLYFIYEDVWDLWLNNFHEPVCLSLKKELALNKLEKLASGDGTGHNTEKWLGVYFEVSACLETPEEEIMEVERAFWKSSAARDNAINREISKGNSEAAVKLLRESRRLDSEYRGAVIEYTKKLTDLYDILGDEESRKKELMLLVIKYNPCDLEAFRQLKELYSEEQWEKVREGIFKSLKNRIGLDALYNEEKLYDRLFEYVKERGNIYLVEAYEKVLKEHYLPELLELYEAEVRRLARFSGDRKHYRAIVRMMRKMRQYDGGVEAVCRIADDFREKYRRRPAMMEELDRL